MKNINYIFLIIIAFTFANCTETPVFVAPKPIEKLPLDNMIASIHSTPEWIGKLSQESKDKHLNLDSLVLENAIWQLDEVNGKHK